MRTVPAASSMSTAQSSRRSTSAMIDTSMMRGTLVNTVVPEVSNAAAMSFNTLFFAPTTETSPTSRAPPTTRNRSTTRSYPAGSAPAPDRPRRWVGSGKSYAGGMTAADGTAGSAPGDAPADEATGEPDSETGGEPDSGRSRDHSTVHLTRIYTRTGDDGTTALGDMSRTRKTSPRLAAYADVDEAN